MRRECPQLHRWWVGSGQTTADQAKSPDVIPNVMRTLENSKQVTDVN